MYVYWAEVLTNHPKNCDDFFVVQYFGIVHHTLNRNGTYTGRKRNPLHFVEKSLTDESQHKSLTDESQHKSLTDESQHKSLTDESQHKRNSEINKSTFSPFKINARKCDFECPIHGIIKW